MSSRSLQELIKGVDTLSTQEQLRLVAYLAERASRNVSREVRPLPAAFSVALCRSAG